MSEEDTLRPPPQVIGPSSVPSSTTVGEPSVGPTHQFIQVPSIAVEVNLNPPTIWISYLFAPEWFADALHEARNGTDHHARRREILFAVCCAESYLVEWVRDEALNRDFRKLNDFFPPGDKTGVAEKWKRVLKALLDTKLVKNIPELGRSWWEDFQELIELRNGLIHARSSRPETGGLSDKEKPLPSKGDLDQLEPGWPTKVVVALIREVHAATGTPPPKWLVEP